MDIKDGEKKAAMLAVIIKGGADVNQTNSVSHLHWQT
jgi:hypothetical protein